MKDIKSYVTGFITCACLFLIMGATTYNTGNGRYQAFYSEGIGSSMIDTKSGEFYKIGRLSDKESKSLNTSSDIMYKWIKSGLSVKDSPLEED